jgi:hypothetical protein
MDVLFEPAVLVSLIVTLLVAMFSKRLSILGEHLIAHISLIPRRFSKRLRLKRWRSRRNLIEEARGHHRVTLSIARTYALLLVFLFAVVGYLLLIILGPLKGIGQLPTSIQALISSPIYISEILWLLQRERMFNLVRIAESRVTNRSSTCRPAGSRPDALKRAA